MIEKDKKRISNETLELIHKVLHDKRRKYLSIDDRKYEISVYEKNGCRGLRYKGILFVQQDPNAKSIYAEMARKGDKITRGINGKRSNWLLLYNDQVPANKNMFN